MTTSILRTILRTALLLALCLIAILALLVVTEHLLAAPVSFAAGYLAGRLYKRWRKVDPWFIAYEKMCDEVMDAPNPLCKKD